MRSLGQFPLHFESSIIVGFSVKSFELDCKEFINDIKPYNSMKVAVAQLVKLFAHI